MAHHFQIYHRGVVKRFNSGLQNHQRGFDSFRPCQKSTTFWLCFFNILVNYVYIPFLFFGGWYDIIVIGHNVIYEIGMVAYMKKTVKKAMVGIGVTAAVSALAAGIHHITSRYLVKLAISRQVPKRVQKDKERLLSSSEISDVVTTLSEAAQSLEAIEHETVELTAEDGTNLIGHWFYGDNPKRVIVAMHGWRSSWSQDFGAIAPFWLAQGCAVLFAEQRGQGKSGGEYMGFGLLERFDCLEWIKWADKTTEGKLPIYLGGISMGATTVLMASGLELPESVRGVIADCGFTSPRAIWKHVVETNLHLPYSIYSSAARDICQKHIQVENDNYSTTDALQSCKLPVLFIHGTDDHFVPAEMTYENYRAYNGRKRLFVVPGAEHGMSYFIDREGYEKELIAFWQEYDGAR